MRLASAAVIITVAAAVVSGPPGAAVNPPLPGIVDINTKQPFQHEIAAGTGIVLSGRGDVLTNNHVIRGATSISITDLDNGRRYSARIVGYDVAADVAILQLRDASNLPTITLGDSRGTRIGDPVTAYGNAGGLGGAPTSAQGKIVGLDKTILEFFDDGGTQPLAGLVETDAALEPGDSGGPLVDRAGKVVGLDTAGGATFKLGSTARSRGWAIAINRATSIAKQIATGHSSKTVHIGPTAFLGVNFQPSLAFTGLTPGLTVVSVAPHSPAANAGLTAGDVVSNLDGKSIKTPADLSALMLTKIPGSRLQLTWTDVTGGQHNATFRSTAGPPQ